jgi:hypothetical protein
MQRIGESLIVFSFQIGSNDMNRRGDSAAEQAEVFLPLFEYN